MIALLKFPEKKIGLEYIVKIGIKIKKNNNNFFDILLININR